SPVRQLTDITRLKRFLTGLKFRSYVPPPADSLTWATSEELNARCWQSARDDQYRALVSGARADREENLARMLFALGSLIHLNQDLSQPDHARNSAHPPEEYGGPHWIEDY